MRWRSGSGPAVSGCMSPTLDDRLWPGSRLADTTPANATSSPVDRRARSAERGSDDTLSGMEEDYPARLLAREAAPAYDGEGPFALWHFSEDTSLGVFRPRP